MTDLYTNRHERQRAARDADQVETIAVTQGSAIYDLGIADERIAGSLQELEADAAHADRIAMHQEDLNTEGAVGRISEEVKRRSALMGASYPFEVHKSRIEYRPSKSRFYEFCLAITQSPTITKTPYVELPRKFERAAAALVHLFLGEPAQVLHTGAPRDANIGTTFKKGMSTLAARCGEWVWCPEDELPEHPSQGGDEGVDFVVWKPMPDSRRGSLFLLCQCACGDDWLGKWNDLRVERLEKWFRPMTSTPPVRAFATPFHVVDGLLAEAMREAGLVFDRARLAMIAESNHDRDGWKAWPAILDPITSLVLQQSAA